MTIADAKEKCKSLAGRVPRDAIVISVLILASSASFGLGYLAGRDAGQGSGGVGDSPTAVSPSTGRFVASKSGTKYYLPDCAGAGRISEANKVWFISAAAAVAAGYEPAANCGGL